MATRKSNATLKQPFSAGAQALDRRAVFVLCAAVFLLALALYWVTLAPTITWRFSGSDSGDLASAAYSWGIPHPTGYPLWTMLGFMITRIPLGDPAARTNLLSAIFGAGAAVFVVLAVLRLSGMFTSRTALVLRLIAAGGAGLALATAPAFWSQSILTEVYSLNALLVAVIVWLTVPAQAPSAKSGSLRGSSTAATSSPRAAGGTAPLAFACGLALTDHSTAIFAVVAAVFAAVLRRKGARPRLRAVLLDLALFLLPLLLYLLIPWRAAQHPAENWNDPQTLSRFLQVVSGAQYHYLLDWRNPVGAVQSMPAILRLFLGQFAWWGLPLALYGLLLTWDIDRPFAAFSVLMLVFYSAFTAIYRADGAAYYLLPAYLVEAVLIGAGLAGLGADLAGWSASRRLPEALPALALAAVVLLSLVPFTAFNFAGHNLRNDRTAYHYAQATLAAQPRGATLRTNSDEQSFSLWYLQRVAGFRRDVHVIDTRLAAIGVVQ